MYKWVYNIFVFLFLFSILNSNSVYSFPNQEPKTQREFDEDFKSRYESDTYDYEGIESSSDSSNNTTNREASEYSDDVPDNSTKNNNKSIDLGFITWIFIGIFLVAIGFILYTILGDGNKSFFNSGKLRKINEFEITTENIENVNISHLIEEAEHNEDFRLAIRYNYLLLLKTLSFKNLIVLEDDKTNNDYVNELRQQPFSNAFQYISYLYNYIWYGEFLINKSQYQLAKSNFSNLINQVK